MPATRSLFGFHAVTARLRQRPEAVHALYVLTGRGRTRGCATSSRARKPRGCAVHLVDHARLDALAGHGRHQGVVAIVDDALPHVTLDDVLDSPAEPPLLLVLDGVTDPHNLGACLRCADAFGAHGGDRAQGSRGRRQCDRREGRVGRGRHRARDRRHQPRAHDARAQGARRVGAGRGRRRRAAARRPISPGGIAWVLGAEGAGLRRLTRESCDRIVGIPLAGSVASLNVSVAAGICLYATRAARSRAQVI